jgi:ribonuclease D
MTTVEEITDAAGVASLLADVRREGRCALDTEFVWERTYAPVLCLVQIATADRLAVIDPLRGAPLEPVAQLVADPAVVKAMHAPGADLTGFALHFGTGAAAVYDAQLAAGFAGLGGSLSLERMLEQSVGVKLKHHEGFTDWSKRPLTPAQVAYAADDVVTAGPTRRWNAAMARAPRSSRIRIRPGGACRAGASFAASS